MPLSRAFAAAALVFAACAADPLPAPDGPHYQYVVSELKVPESNMQARDFSLDLNADKAVDNQLGMVFSTLHQMGLGVGETATESLLRGGLIMLTDLQTPDFDNTDVSAVTMYLGRDPVPAPCLDPTRLETCGQHLLGTGEFAVADTASSDLAVAPIIDNRFVATMGRLPVQIAIFATEPLRLDLHGARIRLTGIAPGHVSGVLAGGITKADIEDTVIPEAAAQIDRIIVAECGQPSGASPCGCIAGTRASSLRYYFDANNDCRVGSAELATNSIAQSLLAPDIRVDGEMLLSFGVGVELVSATFPPP